MTESKKTITVLVILIALFSAFAAAVGIFSDGASGPTSIISVRGQEVTLYGKGVYHHMSAQVAPQGIAQDVVTLFIAVPLLLIGLFFFRRGSIKAKVFLSGMLGYFLITYLFYTMMAMYNQLFLLWVVLLSLSFHAFYLSFGSLKEAEVMTEKKRASVKFIGGFLIFCSVTIGMLWLSIVVPPMLTGTLPLSLEHYTTLVVQALDLAIALPAAFIAGALLIRGKPFGYKLSSVYLVFLSLLMTALTAKVFAMAWLGYNVVPVIFIIPAFNMLSILCAVMMIRSLPAVKIAD